MSTESDFKDALTVGSGVSAGVQGAFAVVSARAPESGSKISVEPMTAIGGGRKASVTVRLGG